ncbi:MAG: hypothetical protein SVW57_07265 [Thermodesulfobacteriota bacterium]|nr:hypothetical protein [Thermodesulfobacteriota bacterium]
MKRSVIVGVSVIAIIAGVIYLWGIRGHRSKHGIVKSRPPTISHEQTQAVNRDRLDAHKKESFWHFKDAKDTHAPSSVPQTKEDFAGKSPDNLATIVLAHKDRSPESQEPLHSALNTLCALSLQGSHEATKELINLSSQFDDKKILHTILQALGRTKLPESDRALLSAIQQNLDDPVSVIRISSYYSGELDSSIVDELIRSAQDKDTDPEVSMTLLNTVMRKGGSYERDQAREVMKEIREKAHR